MASEVRFAHHRKGRGSCTPSICRESTPIQRLGPNACSGSRVKCQNGLFTACCGSLPVCKPSAGELRAGCVRLVTTPRASCLCKPDSRIRKAPPMCDFGLGHLLSRRKSSWPKTFSTTRRPLGREVLIERCCASQATNFQRQSTNSKTSRACFPLRAAIPSVTLSLHVARRPA